MTSPENKDANTVSSFCGIPAEELQAACFNIGLTMKARASFVTSILNANPGAPPVKPVSQGIYDQSVFITTTPAVTLRPITVIRRDQFEDLQNKQPLWNILIDAMARHPTFLSETLRDTAESDSAFTGKMVSMYQELYDVRCSDVQNNNDALCAVRHYSMQPMMLGVFRNDYMEEEDRSTSSMLSKRHFHKVDSNSDIEIRRRSSSTILDNNQNSNNISRIWKQVEINTISVSFAGLSSLVAKFHQLISCNVLNDNKCVSYNPNPMLLKDSEIHMSESLRIVPAALATAAKYYIDVEMSTSSIYVPVVCFVIQENERNTADQFALSFEIESRHGVRCIRRTLLQINDTLELLEQDDDDDGGGVSAGTLPRVPRGIIDGRFEVAVFFFRSCYTPGDFTVEEQWNARRSIEISNAIKCPSLPHYLCTFKKVQQVLTGFMHIKSHNFPHSLEDVCDVAKSPAEINCGGNNGAVTEDNTVLRFIPHAKESIIEVPYAATGERLNLIRTNKDTLPPFEVPVPVEENTHDAIDVTYFTPQQNDKDEWMEEWIRSNMVPLYSLNPAENSQREAVILDAIRHPYGYVMKPQLEGGGNLFAGDEMVSLLKVLLLKSSEEEPDADQLAMYNRISKEYILMSRINIKRHACTERFFDEGYYNQQQHQSEGETTLAKSGLSSPAALTNPDEPSPLFRFGSIIKRSLIRGVHVARNYYPSDDLCSELGIYGVVLTTSCRAVSKIGLTIDTTYTTATANKTKCDQPFDVKILFNQAAGYVVRSKLASVDDGGVMAGAAFLDSIGLLAKTDDAMTYSS